jgi:hypothetical protein
MRLLAASLLLLGPLGLTLGLVSRDSASSASAQQPDPKAASPVSFANDVQPFLAKHCYECHGNGKKKGEMSLEKFTDDESVLKDRQTWDNIQHMIRTGQMPPKERPKPAAAEVAKMLGDIQVVLNSLDCTKNRNVGRVTLHRLNRAEYNNTIRDLVGVDFKPAADFPSDDVGYGFDNIGDVLTVSPLLLEKYLSAAEEILDRALAVVEAPKPTKSGLSNFRTNPFGAGGVAKGLGNYITVKGDISADTNFEVGDYFFRAEVAAEQAGDEPVKCTLWIGEAEIVKDVEVRAPTTKFAIVEGKLRVAKAGTARVYVGLTNPFTETIPAEPDKKDAVAGDGKQAAEPKVEKKQRKLYVKSIAVEGPFNPPAPPVPESTKRLLARDADLAPREAARQVVGRFAAAAFRRPVTPEEVERLLSLYDKAASNGERFENCVRLAMYRVLCSPHFLFRVELDPPDAKPGTAYLIDEYSLASRLSYFLWSSMPDEELTDLAGKGQLRKSLQGQVERMLKDPKSAAFVQNFAGQWLTLRNLASANPEPKDFPTFNEDLRSAMYRETEMFFESMLREDRNIFDFLDADFTFVNEVLAKHYGIEGVKGKQFQRVKAPPNRAGVLTHASILTMNSRPYRTSPVLRGKWVLEQILNSPPPPPPPDVPSLDDGHELKGSLRQIMEQHRENPTCASCHQRMDPIGFAFENYDGIGAWRVKDGKFDIDSSGVLPDGKTFKGPAELITILKNKKDLFSRCLSEKVLTYALGRGLEFYDKCAVDRIMSALEANNYRFSTLLLEVVKSEPFQMRMAAQAKK